jgi:hypothetical protein
MAMKPLGTLHPTEWGPIVATCIQNFVLSSGVVTPADWGAASAGSSNPRYVDIHSDGTVFFAT